MTKSRGIQRPRFKWTDEAEATLIARYPHEKTEYIARDLGLAMHQVYARARKLGLAKTPEYLASEDACRLRRGDGVGVAHRFPKGHIPVNKGKKGISHPNMKASQFKKGELNGRARKQLKPIGYETVNAHGYLVRKVNNGQPPQRRWKAVHRIVWEEAHGPIPEGLIVVFKPGSRTTVREEITLDRLEMISRRENLDRNSLYNYPKEIQEVVHLRACLTRKINNRSPKNDK